MSGTYIFPTEHPQPFGTGEELKGSELKNSQLQGSPQLAIPNRSKNRSSLIGPLVFYKFLQVCLFYKTAYNAQSREGGQADVPSNISASAILIF
jgi:hypothetical protein